jgi:CheY-like chemotaxis protein
MKDGVKVLYVEDISSNQALIKSFFQQWNESIQLDIAETAEIARSMLADNQYQLILMDLNLPGENGIDFTFSLKRNINFATIPVIALTAKIMDEDIQEIKKLFDAYITKPVNFMELTFVLEKHLVNQ